jgi:hypothetical protein
LGDYLAFVEAAGFKVSFLKTNSKVSVANKIPILLYIIGCLEVFLVSIDKDNNPIANPIAGL